MKTKLMSFVIPAALVSLVILGSRPCQAAILKAGLCPGATHATIQAAVNAAAAGDTVQVCPGAFLENVTIPAVKTGLKLEGAQANQPVAGRTLGSPFESTVYGQITVQAADVTINGLSITYVVAASSASGIVVKTSGSGAVIANNIIDTVSTSNATGTAQGIYLENGPDNVSITDNWIRNIQSQRSAKGILIGDSLANDPSVQIVIERNVIEDITSATRGAYGIQVNNGADPAPTANGFTQYLYIQNNTIDDLTGGGWAHAIGLEGNTPDYLVRGNSISDVVDLTTSPINDAVAVLFEANPSFFRGNVNENNFDRVEYGIAVHPALGGGSVDGTCNWWGNPSGPGPDGPGTGAKVTPNVIYEPWLSAPGGACFGAPASTPGAKVTGGGTVLVPGGRATFSISAQVKKDGTVQGNVVYKDSANGEFVNSIVITAVVVSTSHAQIFGTANVNGTVHDFVVDVDDNGEPGAGKDTFSINLTDGYSSGPVGTKIESGNIQIHKIK